jgi:hypothetical protein
MNGLVCLVLILNFLYLVNLQQNVEFMRGKGKRRARKFAQIFYSTVIDFSRLIYITL